MEDILNQRIRQQFLFDMFYYHKEITMAPWRHKSSAIERFVRQLVRANHKERNRRFELTAKWIILSLEGPIISKTIQLKNVTTKSVEYFFRYCFNFTIAFFLYLFLGYFPVTFPLLVIILVYLTGRSY